MTNLTWDLFLMVRRFSLKTSKCVKFPEALSPIIFQKFSIFAIVENLNSLIYSRKENIFQFFHLKNGENSTPKTTLMPIVLRFVPWNTHQIYSKPWFISLGHIYFSIMNCQIVAWPFLLPELVYGFVDGRISFKGASAHVRFPPIQK